MSKNPKGTIALAFVLTFVLGLGAGYLMHGTMQGRTAGQLYTVADDIAGNDLAAPAPPAAEAAPEALAPARERRGAGDGDGRGEGAGMAGREGPGTGQGYREVIEHPESTEPAEETGAVQETAADRPARVRTDGETEDAAPERRYRSQEERAQDAPEMDMDADRSERRRLWRSRTPDDGESTAISRFRLRLIRDLDLTEEEADSFFSILESHRNDVREEVVIPQRELHQRHRELSEQLENELEAILSEEQMATWRERYAPRMDRRSGEDTDRRNRRQADEGGEDEPNSDDE